jgi:hypothetical protein
MMKKKLIGTGVTVIAGLVIACLALGFINQKQEFTAKETRESLLYRGLDYTVYSKSMVDKPYSSYTFEPALQFDYVEHDFILKNNSSEPLEIIKAEGCCGCLVKTYSRQIPPGLTGKISVLIITDTRGGTEVSGTIRALTNDPSNPEITIDVSCPIKQIAAIDPFKIMLTGSYNSDLKGTSIVIPEPDFPFAITGIKPKKGMDISHSFREILQDGRKAYEITVTNTRKQKGIYRDTLFIQTDHPRRPEFRIRVQGEVFE